MGRTTGEQPVEEYSKPVYILSKWKQPNQGFEIATLGPLSKALKESYPNLVANYCRYDGITSNISKGDKSFRENIQLGDSTMLNMYGFSLLHGNPSTAFNGAFTVIVTDSKAISCLSACLHNNEKLVE